MSRFLEQEFHKKLCNHLLLHTSQSEKFRVEALMSDIKDNRVPSTIWEVSKQECFLLDQYSAALWFIQRRLTYEGASDLKTLKILTYEYMRNGVDKAYNIVGTQKTTNSSYQNLFIVCRAFAALCHQALGEPIKSFEFSSDGSAVTESLGIPARIENKGLREDVAILTRIRGKMTATQWSILVDHLRSDSFTRTEKHVAPVRGIDDMCHRQRYAEEEEKMSEWRQLNLFKILKDEGARQQEEGEKEMPSSKKQKLQEPKPSSEKGEGSKQINSISSSKDSLEEASGCKQKGPRASESALEEKQKSGPSRRRVIQLPERYRDKL